MHYASRPDRTSAEQRIARVVRGLSENTTVAMLRGLRRFPGIAAGNYSLRGGRGVCPMLAAQRCGAVDHELGFAPAWDEFVAAHQRIRLGGSPVDRMVVDRLERMLSAHLAEISRRPAFECDRCGIRTTVDSLGACRICGGPLSGPEPEAQRRSASVPTTAS